MPPKNGSPVGRQEDRHRPAAVTGHRDDRVHVDGVEVGPLLAVDLDVHEVLVHQRRRLGVLERLVLHHVAPVAGRVADREQDRPVLLARAGERLVAPGVPVDGVLGVLEQVGAGLRGEPVHALTIIVAVPFTPLAGIRVVDVTTSFAGPTCTQLLGALGADVIKIEPPAGDEARLWGPPFAHGLGSLFIAANSGKRSVAVDLRRGNDVVQRLVDTRRRVHPEPAPRPRGRARPRRGRAPRAQARARPLHDLAVRPPGPEGEPAGLRPAAPGRRRADLESPASPTGPECASASR